MTHRTRAAALCNEAFGASGGTVNGTVNMDSTMKPRKAGAAQWLLQVKNAG